MIHRILDNIRSARFDRREFSGSLGDMGLYLPLVTAFVTVAGLDLGAILFFSGLFNILSGVLFGIPVCVQPMKAIAAVAISEGLSVHEVLAAGILLGGILFLFGVTGLVTWLARWIPKPIVRGIQVGIGLKLIMDGMLMIEKTGGWFQWDGYLAGIVSVLFILAFFLYQRVPVALIIFFSGLVFAFVQSPEIVQMLQPKLYFPHLVSLNMADFLRGGVHGGLPQLPLTLLNSVIALCALSRELFPAKPIDEKEISISVGLMNIVGCALGGMPSCHGSGGLAGQYAYGARTGGSMIILGSIKMILAICLGATVLPIFIAYPKSILGALLFFSGIELVLQVKDMQRKKDLMIVFLVVAGILSMNTLAGVVVGSISYLISSRVWPLLERL